MTASLFAQTKKVKHAEKVGDVAPDFTLHYFDGTDRKEVKLNNYRGKKNVGHWRSSFSPSPVVERSK